MGKPTDKDKQLKTYLAVLMALDTVEYEADNFFFKSLETIGAYEVRDYEMLSYHLDQVKFFAKRLLEVKGELMN